MEQCTDWVNFMEKAFICINVEWHVIGGGWEAGGGLNLP